MITRYFVEHLAEHPDPHHVSQRSRVHKHCREYHWVRIDSDTIVGIGHFRNGAAVVRVREHVSVLPHLHDTTPVKALLPAQKHAQLAAVIGLSDNDSTSDLVGKLIARGFGHFEPPY